MQRHRGKHKLKILAIVGTLTIGSILSVNTQKASANIFRRFFSSVATSIRRALPGRSGSTGSNFVDGPHKKQTVLPESPRESYNNNVKLLNTRGSLEFTKPRIRYFHRDK